MDAHKVLSFSPDREALFQRAAALHRAGFEVFSTSIENHARTEIETGRCGVLLICFRVPLLQANDLASLFRKNCPDGRVIFVVNDTHDLAADADADAFLPDSKGPEAIVQALRSALRHQQA
jgi:DNA-binding NarL/FixJ family response regulator